MAVFTALPETNTAGLHGHERKRPMKTVTQISVFLENKSGRLAEVTRVLAENELNIRALSLADASNFGEFRILVAQPDDAYMRLKEKHYTVKETDVFAVEMPDRPGALAAALQALYENQLNVEYLYEFPRHDAKDKAIVIFKFDDMSRAEGVLQDQGLKFLDADALYAL